MKKVSIQIAVTAGILIAVCLTVILSVRKTIVTIVPNPGLPDNSGWQQPENLFIEMEPEGIVAFEGVQVHGNDMKLRVKAVAPGKTEFCYFMKAADSKHHVFFSVSRGLFLTANNSEFPGLPVLLLSAGVFLAAVCFFFLNFFIRVRGSALYSYLSIFSVGFALFTGMAAVSILTAGIRFLVNPYSFGALSALSSIADTASKSMWYAAVPMILFSGAMVVSNIELLRHERFRMANILGLIIPLFLTGGLLIPFLAGLAGFQGSFEEYRLMETFRNTYATVYMYFVCMLAGSVICGLRAAKRKADFDKDFIIILGCRFRKDGSLTPLLKGRCDRAIRFYREQKETTGREAVLIPSGGQGADESMPEADAMAAYLISQGIPESAVIREDQSRNTYQNMEFSKKIIDAAKPDAKTVFSTTNYHVFRSGLWASLAGLPAEGIGSSTKWWFWPNAFMRECIGLMANRIRTEILLLVATVAVNILLSWLTIR